MVNNIKLKVRGYFDTLDVDGKVKNHTKIGEMDYSCDMKNVIKNVLLTGEYDKIPLPQTDKNGHLWLSDLCRYTLGCSSSFNTDRFKLIETEPISNNLKFVFVDKKKHIFNKWVSV